MIPFPDGLVEGVFGLDMRHKYGLELLRIDDREILLISERYAIRLAADPREKYFSIEYIDIQDGPDRRMDIYELGHFLALKRPIPPWSETPLASEETKLHAGLRRIRANLLERCEDILQGEKGWLKIYEESWGIRRVWHSLESAIWQVLDGRA